MHVVELTLHVTKPGYITTLIVTAEIIAVGADASIDIVYSALKLGRM
jgi:hypothetical protein